MKTIVVKDESISGKILNEISLKFENDYITVKELISRRVEEEVENYKHNLSAYTKKTLVVPSDLEKRLNQKSDRQIDVEKQVYVALESFQSNGFFILIDDEQVEELDQKFLIDESTKISFIKLTPLVGG